MILQHELFGLAVEEYVATKIGYVLEDDSVVGHELRKV